MKITTTARHYELTPALKDYAEKKVYNLKKYFDQIFNAQITFSMEKYRHAVEIAVHVNGKDFNGREESEDMYASIDRAIDKLERQILKHKGKIKKRKSHQKISTIEYEYPEDTEDPGEESENGVEVISSNPSEFPASTLKEAMDELKGSGKEFIIFANVVTEKVNVLFLRSVCLK
jgi:putative sigma-54 modulation protein